VLLLFAEVTLFSLLEAAGTTLLPLLFVLFDLGELTMDEVLSVLPEGTGSAEKDTEYTGAASVVVMTLFGVVAATAVFTLFETQGVFSPRSQ
jgi:hypothetical protein